jgi:enterochelin esterase family protein
MKYLLGLLLCIVAAIQPEQRDFVLKPPYTDTPELTAKDGVPKGTLHEFIMKSADSKIYPGISKTPDGPPTPYERAVAVYVPAQYKPGTAAPFIVIQDGASARNRAIVAPILDNLIHEKRIPVMIAVLVHHGGGDGPGSERGLEYDTVSDRYTTFIEQEVLPRVTRDYNLTLTKDPEGRATMGGSSGAACAFTMAWFHPELYRRVLSYSGTFVNQENPRNPEISRGAWEYHATLIPNSPPKPIRIWMHVGEKDNGYTRDEASLHNWVIANQHMAAALKAKNYQYRYIFAEDSGHTEGAVINQTLPAALEWLWQGYAR